MAKYNAITGLKRKAARRDLPRKKRSSLSSTIEDRMYADQAMEAYEYLIVTCQLFLVNLALISRIPNFRSNHQAMIKARVFVMGASICLIGAIKQLILDSELLDLDEDHDDEGKSGFNKELQDITTESFENDDECYNKTRFTKSAILAIVDALQLPHSIRIYYNFPDTRFYKFKIETLFIYMLRKMATARTHSDLCDSEFGGASARWAIGYKYILKQFDSKFAHLIGPQGLERWAPQFPYFAEIIREYIQRDKERTDAAGNPTIRGMPLQRIGPGEFNVFSVTDCTVYEICRPGSGPANNNNGAGRRENW